MIGSIGTPLQKTALHSRHRALGAKMTDFHGWDMPLYYTSILEEHQAVRNALGLFDISHMGQVIVTGPDACRTLNHLMVSDISQVGEGRACYTLMLNPEGGILDDLIIYRLGEEDYLVIVNCGNRTSDVEWLHAHKQGQTTITNISEGRAILAVQGPRAEGLVGRLADRGVTAIGYFRFAHGAVAGVPALISRSGYTGEDGFELYVPAAETARLWQALLDAGAADGVAPIGLGARDTLRLEMRYTLYGNDIDQTTNPLEAGLGWAVKPAKGEFIGRDAIERVRAEGPRRRLVGLEMADRSIARHEYAVVKDGRHIGVITSGSYGPSVDRSIALAYIEPAHAAVGTELAVEIRGQARAGRVVRTPFYPPKVKR